MEIVTPFVGVWIEIYCAIVFCFIPIVTPFVGVWIEILLTLVQKCIELVTPFVGVWIEIACNPESMVSHKTSLPSWECGLK